MTEEELYGIERWVEKMERSRLKLRREQAQNGTMAVALRHLGALTVEVRRLKGLSDWASTEEALRKAGYLEDSE